MENQKDSHKDKDKDKDGPKEKAVGAVLGEIEKQFGKGAIMRLGVGGEGARAEAGVVSTGSLGLDIALGTGGLPRGRIVEVYGPESSGKTTLALHVLAEAQRVGGTCAFIDAEHALDVGYARKLGVKTEDLLLSQPDNGEQALEITDMLVKSEVIDVIVIDSVAALVPKAELEGEMGDSHVGLQARLMSQALRKLTGAVARGKTHGHLHQPAAHEDRRDVREPGDDDGRQRAEVLRVGAAGRAAHRRAEGRRAGGRQPHAREGGEEQDGGAVPRDGVRRRVRAGDLAGGGDHRPGRRGGPAGEERRLDRLRRRAAGQRARGGPAVPAGAPGSVEGPPHQAARARGDRRCPRGARGRGAGAVTPPAVRKAA